MHGKISILHTVDLPSEIKYHVEKCTIATTLKTIKLMGDFSYNWFPARSFSDRAKGFRYEA